VIKKNKTFPYPLEYAKDQNIIGTKEISGERARGNFLVFSKGHLAYPATDSIYATPTGN